MSTGMGRKGVISAGMLCAMAGLAMAAPPPVADRVPANAAGVVMVRNISESHDRVKHIIEMFPKRENAEDEDPLKEIDEMLDTPGFNKSGSAAMVLLPGVDGTVTQGQDPDIMVIVPVSDYKAFVTKFGGNASDKVTKVEFKKDGEAGGEEDKPKFARDIGGGYAIVTSKQEIAEAFEGKGGNAEAHAKLMGKAGSRIADDANVLLVGNFKALQPAIHEMVEGIKSQGEMASMMMGANPQAGNQAAAGIAMFTSVIENLEKDGQSGVMGVNIGDAGITLDFGAQFSEGTESAKMFDGEGHSDHLIKSLPNQPFYFAGAVDTSHAGLKQMLTKLQATAKAAAEEAAKKSADNSGKPATTKTPGTLDNFMSTLDNSTGYAFSMGQSPALMGGGLLLRTTAYSESADPAKLLATMRENTKKADGMVEGGLTTKVTYTPDAAKVGDVSADSWKIGFTADPNDPSAAQAKQMMGMIFGPGGLSGMVAPAKHGLVSIMSNDTDFLGKSLEAANGGKNQGDDEQLAAAAGHLPKGRNAEFYIGVKPIAESVLGLMAMFSGNAPEVKLPEKVSPIAIGAATDAGAGHIRVFVPQDVVQTLADIAKSMKEQNEAPAEAPAPKNDDDKSKSPRF